MHRETSACAISQFKKVITTFDMLTTEANCRRYQRSDVFPVSVLMLLLLFEALVLINNSCCFPQMRTLYYSFIISKFQQVVTKFPKLEENLPNHGDIDVG